MEASLAGSLKGGTGCHPELHLYHMGLKSQSRTNSKRGILNRKVKTNRYKSTFIQISNLIMHKRGKKYGFSHKQSNKELITSDLNRLKTATHCIGLHVKTFRFWICTYQNNECIFTHFFSGGKVNTMHPDPLCHHSGTARRKQPAFPRWQTHPASYRKFTNSARQRHDCEHQLSIRANHGRATRKQRSNCGGSVDVTENELNANACKLFRCRNGT